MNDFNEWILSKSIVRLSFTIIFIICVILFFVGFTSEWPSSVQGRFSLTKGCRPYSVTSPCRGEISYLVNINDTININEPVAYMLGHGDYASIIDLKNDFEVNDSKPMVLIPMINHYGDISKCVLNYVCAVEEYRISSESKISSLNLEMNKEQIENMRMREKYILESISKAQEELAILTNHQEQDSVLLSYGAITKFEAEKSALLRIQKESELLKYGSDLALINRSITETLNESRIIEVTRSEDVSRLMLDVNKAHSELKDALIEWCNQYELKSPINGIMENPLRINNRQLVEAGTEVFRVLPIDGSIEGEVYFEASKSYGIKNGMNVKLILDDYDENDYGYLVGHIEDISSSVIGTKDSFGYTCVVYLDISNQSTFHAPIDFKFGMGGTVKFEIQKRSVWDKFKVWLFGNTTVI